MSQIKTCASQSRKLKIRRRVPAWLLWFCFAGGLFFGPHGCAYAEMLDLEAAVVTGGSSIDFGNLRSLDTAGSPAGDSALRQVRLSVVSDLGRPYLITQMLQDFPTNPNGSALEAAAIRYSVTVEQGGGIVRVGDLEPLKPGAQEIYISSDNEARTVLLIAYDFIVPPGQKAGRYQGIVTFQVNSR